MMRWTIVWLICMVVALGANATTPSPDLSEGDPLRSMQWPELKKQYLKGEKQIFDSRVVINGPRFAEDALSVPVQIDAQALVDAGLTVLRMVVLVDRNPIRKVLDFEPMKAQPRLTFRFKLEQSSPVRVLVLDSAGLWHVNSIMVNATGGGCTVSGDGRKNGTWIQTLNQVQLRFFSSLTGVTSSRMRLMVMHPMDTGLVAGIPPLYIEQLQITDAHGQPLWRLQLFEPVAENPIFSFDFVSAPTGRLRLTGTDNNGNLIDQEFLR